MEPRTLKYAAYVAVALVGGLALAVAPLFLVSRLAAGWGPAMALTGFVLAAVFWTTFFTVKAHGRLDVFQREKAKNAVFWGVPVGIIASAPIYAFVEVGGLNRLAPALASGKTVAIAFANGYGLALIFLTAGICVAAAWLRAGRASA